MPPRPRPACCATRRSAWRRSPRPPRRSAAPGCAVRIVLVPRRARHRLRLDALLLFQADQIVDLGLDPVVDHRRLAALLRRLAVLRRGAACCRRSRGRARTLARLRSRPRFLEHAAEIARRRACPPRSSSLLCGLRSFRLFSNSKMLLVRRRPKRSRRAGTTRLGVSRRLHLVEQLSDQPERVHLIVMLAGGEAQQLASQCRDTKAHSVGT